jgi:hypothetical protein
MYRFYLETEYVGPVDIAVHSVNKTLAITFTLSDEALANIFDEQAGMLRDMLHQHGYQVNNICCRAGKIVPLYLLGSDSETQHQCINISV